MPTASLQRGITPPPTCILNLNLKHLMPRLQLWNFGKCGVLTLLPGPLWSGVQVRVPSTSQIERCYPFSNLKWALTGLKIMIPTNYLFTNHYQYICTLPDIGMMVREFANGPGRIIPKTQKRVLDTSLLKTLNYKVRIKGKVEQSMKRSGALPFTLV